MGETEIDESEIESEMEIEIEDEDEDVLSSITSTLSSLKENNLHKVVGAAATDDDLETVETYKSSLDRMEEEESLSFLQSSVKEESNEEEAVGNEEQDHDDDDVNKKSDLISMYLISDMVANLFSDTANLYELRQNRASILLRQSHLEQSINESVGILSDHNKKMKNTCQISRDCTFIKSYIDKIFQHCEKLDWSSDKEVESIKIDFCVFIHIETISNRSEEQQIFNNLIFDTLNEVLIDYKAHSNGVPSKEKIIETVQRKIDKITICETDEELKEHFVDEQVIENRIRSISNEWMHEFEECREWAAAFDNYKELMKVQIADSILDDMLTDTAFELNQIERYQRTQTVM